MTYRASIVVLSYNRPNEIYRNLKEICNSVCSDVEIIVVDNFSDMPVADVVNDLVVGDFPRVKVLRMNDNLGVSARNIGVSKAQGEYVLTVDDDVFGLTDSIVTKTIDYFESFSNVSAINFKVVDDFTGEQTNWIHHRDLSIWSDLKFDTYEISEGAVAFRRDCFLMAGGYPERFFISHEGPDLALRIMSLNRSVIYVPDIVVRHSHSSTARVSWRRYYYDTRNTIWLAIRNYPARIFIRKVPVALIALLAYSIRDGYFRYWVKGLFDGVKVFFNVLSERKVMSSETVSKYNEIGRNNVGLLKLLKVRLFSRNGVRI